MKKISALFLFSLFFSGCKITNLTYSPQVYVGDRTKVIVELSADDRPDEKVFGTLCVRADAFTIHRISYRGTSVDGEFSGDAVFSQALTDLFKSEGVKCFHSQKMARFNADSRIIALIDLTANVEGVNSIRLDTGAMNGSSFNLHSDLAEFSIRVYDSEFEAKL